MISALHESHKYFSLWLNWSTPNRAANTGFGSHLGGEYKPLLNSALLLLCHYAAMDHKPSISACFGQKSLSLANWHWVVASGCHAWLSWTKGSHTILHQPVNMLRLWHLQDNTDPRSSQWATSGPFLDPIPYIQARDYRRGNCWPTNMQVEFVHNSTNNHM